MFCFSKNRLQLTHGFRGATNYLKVLKLRLIKKFTLKCKTKQFECKKNNYLTKKEKKNQNNHDFETYASECGQNKLRSNIMYELRRKKPVESKDKIDLTLAYLSIRPKPK